MINLLEDVVDLKFQYRVGRNLCLTHLKILRHLIDSPGYVRTHELVQAIYCDREDGGPLCANDNIRIYISHLKKSLKPGFCIESSKTLGYRLVIREEDFIRILALRVADSLAA